MFVEFVNSLVVFLVENVIGFFLDNGRLIWIIIVEINIVIERVNYMM